MASWSDRLVRGAPYVLLGVSVAWVAERAWGPLKDPDSWWHLRLGEDFLHQGSLSPPGHWSTFATSPWVPTQPLPEVASALVNRWLGLPGLVWMYVAMVVLVVLMVFLLDRRYASPLPAAVAAMLFLAAGEGAMTPRPQLLSYAFLVVVMGVWLRAEQDLTPRWWLVPLSWLWSLCHGFWFVGVGYGALCVVAVVVGRRASRSQVVRLALVPLASAVVVLLNPVGWRVFAAPFVVSERGQYITEWQHPHLLGGPPLSVLLSCVAVVALWVWKREGASWFRVLVVLSAVFWTWYAVRTVIIGAIVVSPLLAAALQSLIPASDETPEPGSTRRERLGLAGAAAALLAVVALVVPHTAADPGRVPLALDGRLDRLPAGTTVFNDFTLGGWLAWRHPDLDRYVDGLADAYPVSHLRDTSTLMSLEPGWQGVLDRSGATVALQEQGSAVAKALEKNGWAVAGSDNGWVLLRRGARLGEG
jgi:hypothetical protein